MAWIKRNLWFFVSSILALALIGLGGWYFYTEYTAEGQSAGKIAEDYDTLRQLNQQSPHPGKPGGAVDNVQAAKDEQAALHAWIKTTEPYFKPVKSMANLNNFPTELDNSVAQLQRQAHENGVTLPPGYYFTFLAQKNMLAIPQNILPQLAARLGEIKAICAILFEAKINNLESIRREALSNDDTNGPDYLPAGQATISTPLADLTPYEVTFDCFSGELASVLSGFAASPHGLVVTSMQVQSGEGGSEAGMGFPGPTPGQYGGPPPGMPGSAFHGGGGGYNPALVRSPVAPPQQRGGMPMPPPANSRPVKFLSEKRLRVILMLDVVKPKTGR